MMLDDGQIQKLDEENDIRISAIFKEYTNRLKEYKLMDYDDQMVYAYMLLRKDKTFYSISVRCILIYVLTKLRTHQKSSMP